MVMDDDTRKLVAESVIAEATGYYKLVVATATLFLGGTLVFWEKVTPTLTLPSLVLLGVGWLFLVASVMLVVFVRRDNIEMGRLALAASYDKCEPIAVRSRRLTTASGICLALGMFFVAAAGMAALGEKAMATEDTAPKGKSIATRSIPFSEIVQPASGGGSKQQGNQGASQGNTSGSQGNTSASQEKK
jgi:hypothetical protein